MPQYKLVVDCSTGKQEYVALTAAEIAEADQLAAKIAEQKEQEEAKAAQIVALKASAKAKLTAGEPLTDEEASAIVI